MYADAWHSHECLPLSELPQYSQARYIAEDRCECALEAYVHNALVPGSYSGVALQHTYLPL